MKLVGEGKLLEGERAGARQRQGQAGVGPRRPHQTTRGACGGKPPCPVDALRNALSAHCFWTLRREGHSARAATAGLVGLSTAAKNELLFARGVNFNDLPAWQKRGVGLWWETFEKPGVDPRSGASVPGTRRRIHREPELPVGDAWAALLAGLAAGEGAPAMASGPAAVP